MRISFGSVIAPKGLFKQNEEKGKNELGSSIDIQNRKELLSKNIYAQNKTYNSNSKNALSDGDERGKGENNGNVGSSIDIQTRIDVVARNKYNGSKGYPDF